MSPENFVKYFFEEVSTVQRLKRKHVSNSHTHVKNVNPKQQTIHPIYCRSITLRKFLYPKNWARPNSYIRSRFFLVTCCYQFKICALGLYAKQTSRSKEVSTTRS